jgi:hypothetical protein
VRLWPRRVALAAAAVWVVSFAWTAGFYFGVYPTVPGLYGEFMGDRVDVGRFIDATDWNGRHLYLAATFNNRGTITPDPFRALPTRFMTMGRVDWTFLDYRRVGDLPADVPLAVLLDAKDATTLAALTNRFPDGRLAYVLQLPQRSIAVFLHGDAGSFNPGSIGPYSNW